MLKSTETGRRDFLIILTAGMDFVDSVYEKMELNRSENKTIWNSVYLKISSSGIKPFSNEML